MTEKYINKQIWKLFKLNRSEINRAEKNIESILFDVYNLGKKDGKKEQRKNILKIISQKHA